jgi:hypothetical protein
MNITHNKNTTSPKLKASVVEPILISCINEISIYELVDTVQKILPLSKGSIKRYLFYLIDYGFILYNGQKQIVSIEDEGFDLLDAIVEEKRQEGTDIDDIIITFE